MKRTLLVLWLACGFVAGADPLPPPALPAALPQGSDVSPSDQAQDALRRGQELAQRGFSDSAIVEFRRAIDLDPDFAPSYIALGKVLLQRRNNAFAIAVYGRLCTLQPEVAEWKYVLLDLYGTYYDPPPPEELKAAADLRRLEPDNVELLRRCAHLYELGGHLPEEAELLRQLAAKAPDLALWKRLGRVENLLGNHREAALAYDSAHRLDPSDQELLRLEGEEYRAARMFAEAEKIFSQEAGSAWRTQLAQTYLEEGDDYLSRDRYATALKLYKEAGQTDQDSALASGLSARHELAERILDPSVSNLSDFGTSGENHYTYLRTLVTVPLRDTEVQLLAGANTYRVGAPDGVGQVTYARLGARYNIDKYWSTTALVETEGLYDVNVRRDDELLQFGARAYKDISNETPLGVGSHYKYDAQSAFANWSATPWLAFNGNLAHAGYSDGSNQLLYNLSASLLPINDPGSHKLELTYRHSADQNDQFVNPLLRFAPANLQVATLGVRWEQVLGADFRYHLGYYHSFANDNSQGDDFVVGGDWRIGEGSHFDLEYSNGRFRNGTISLTGQGTGTAPGSYNLQMDFKLSF